MLALYVDYLTTLWMDDKKLKKSIRNFVYTQRDHMYYIYIKLLIQALTFLFRVEFLQDCTICNIVATKIM